MHKIFVPISNTASINFLATIGCGFYINWQTEKTTIRYLFSFSTAQLNISEEIVLNHSNQNSAGPWIVITQGLAHATLRSTRTTLVMDT